MRKTEIKFIDLDNPEDPSRVRDLPIEDAPPEGTWFRISGGAKLRAHEVVRHYGAKGLLRIEVSYTRLSPMAYSKRMLGHKAAERASKP